VLQVGGYLDLTEEPVGTNRRGELRPKNLDGNRTVVPGIPCQVHSGHATLADLALDRIPPFEGGAELVERV
jgi:hypothetical protein